MKAAFFEKVADTKAQFAAKAGMHECCATALEAGKGCCGKSADEMKAAFDKKSAEARKLTERTES